MAYKKFPLNDYFIKTPIAHRGLHDITHDENSMGAFKQAIANNLPFEIDVHLLKDNELAVVHDNDLKRVTGKKINVTDLNSDDLKNYPLNVSKEIIPLFKDLLKEVNGQVPILIEIKVDGEFNPKLCDILLEQLKDYPYKDRIALQSFHPFAVKYLKEHTNEYSVGLLATKQIEGYSWIVRYLLTKIKLYKYIHADFLSYNVEDMPYKKALKIHKKAQLLLWTVNEEKRYEIAKKYADNIIFEKIDLLNKPRTDKLNATL